MILVFTVTLIFAVLFRADDKSRKAYERDFLNNQK